MGTEGRAREGGGSGQAARAPRLVSLWGRRGPGGVLGCIGGAPRLGRSAQEPRNMMVLAGVRAWARLAGRGAARRQGSGAFAEAREAWTDARGVEHFDSRGPGLRGPTGRLLLWLGGAAGVGSGAVWLMHREEVPFTGRRHLVLLSPRQEREMGANAFAQVLKQYRGRVLPPGHPASRAVRRVGRRIAARATELAGLGVPGQLAHLRGIEWTFTVIDSPEVNAFVLPGGHVCVFSGLLGLFRSDEELAAVLGHEVAHVLARHGAEKASTQMALGAFQLALLSLFDLTQMLSAALLLGVELPHSRSMENEADAIGLQLMAGACYDPQEAPGAFARLGKVSGGARPPAYLSTHPAPADRSERLRQLLPKARRVFEDAGCEAYGSTFRQMFR